MIHFKCPTCGKDYQVKEEFAGRQTSCRQCKQSFTVPGLVAVSVPEAIPVRPRNFSRPPLKRKKRTDLDDLDDLDEGEPTTPSFWLGIISLSLALFSLLMAFLPVVWCLGLPLSGCGILLGIISISMKSPQGQTPAIIGILVSLLVLSLNIAALVQFQSALNSLSGRF